MSFDIKLLPADAKILLIRLRSIGDVVLNTAAFQPIKDNLPHCELHYLVISPVHELVRNNPNLDKVIVMPPGNNAIADLCSTFSLVRKIRRVSYDMIVDMHGGPRSALISALSGAKYKVGLEGSRRSGYYNVTVDPVFDRSALAVRFQMRMLELLGFKIHHPMPKVFVLREEEERIERKLADAGIGAGKTFAVIHPGVDALHNEWQTEKFAAVADELQTRYDLQVVFACAPDQAGQVEDIVKKMATPAHSLAGQTSLIEFAALVRKARLLLCHNSGPMHIGAAVGTPVFALFGSSAPDRWIPQVEPHHVFYKKLECSPCSRNSRKPECYRGDPECKRLISADEVVSAIREKLDLTPTSVSRNPQPE